MNEEEIFGLLKKTRIRIMDKGEYRLTDERAREMAHKLSIEKEDGK